MTKCKQTLHTTHSDIVYVLNKFFLVAFLGSAKGILAFIWLPKISCEIFVTKIDEPGIPALRVVTRTNMGLFIL